MCVKQQAQQPQQPQQHPHQLADCLFVIWHDYEAYGLCLPDDDLTNTGGQLAVIGKQEGKVILTRPIICVDNDRVVTDMGYEYILTDFHPDYEEYREARSDSGIVVVRKYALGILEDGTPYIMGRTDFYEKEAQRFRKAIRAQDGMKLVFTDGTQGFVDPFSIEQTQQYCIYGESWGVRRVPSTQEPKGEPMFGYKGASLPKVFKQYVRYWKEGGIGAAPTLSMEKAKEYNVI